MGPPTGVGRRGRRGAGVVPRGWMAAVMVVAMVVVVVVLGAAAGWAQAGSLALDPDRGAPGTEVTASQSVAAEQCATYRLRWDGESGQLLAVASGADGSVTVTFEVPDAEPGAHVVVATCQPGTGSETAVGQATFTVGGPIPSSTTTTVRRSTSSLTSTPTTTPTTSPTVPSTGPPPEPPPPPPPPPPPAEDFAECERRVRAAQANLVYQPERRMTVGQSQPVVAALALNPFDPGVVTIPGPEETTIVPVPPEATGCLMEARLIGSDFEISPSEPQLQSFRDTTVLTWLWQVRPTREGSDLSLVLRLQPLFREEGQSPLPGPDETFEAIIDVDAEPRSLWSQVGGWISAFFGNEAVRYLLLPGGGGIVTVLVAQRVRGRNRRVPDRS